MEPKLKNHLRDLKIINAQRRAWLVLSALVIVVIGFIIFDNSRLVELHLLWTVGISGLVLSVVWWYWAMRIINKLVVHRKEETEVLIDLCESIKEIKEDVRKNFTNTVD